MKMMHKVNLQTIITVSQKHMRKCQSNNLHGLIGLSPLPLATPLVYSIVLYCIVYKFLA